MYQTDLLVNLALSNSAQLTVNPEVAAPILPAGSVKKEWSWKEVEPP